MFTRLSSLPPLPRTSQAATTALQVQSQTDNQGNRSSRSR
jgi:hypothetical protein